MVAKMQVIDERFEDVNFKSGKRRVRRLTMLDLSRPAFLNTVDWEPSEAESGKLPPEGQIVGQAFTLGIRNIQPGFGGRTRLMASLESEQANGKSSAQPVK
jgi:hypothetical protein